MKVQSYRRRGRGRRRAAFTLIEMIVATVIVSVAIVAVFGAIRALTAAEAKAKTVELLQGLAADQMAQIGNVNDPNNLTSSGDFTTEGYPNVTYTVDLETTDTTNLDKVTVTVTMGNDKQTLNQLFYVPATTSSSSATPTGATP